MANGAAQHATHHGTQDGAGSAALRRCGLHHGLVIALLPRHFGTRHPVDRVHAQHIGPTVMGVVVVLVLTLVRVGTRVLVPRILRKHAGGHQG